MKKIVSTVLIICSLICICIYTHTIGVYFIPANNETEIAIKGAGMHVEKVQVHLSGNQCIHTIYSYPDTDKITEEKETVMETKTVAMYMEEAQVYIENEDYLSAIEILSKGTEETGDAALAEKEKDLREHIVVKNQKQKVYEEGKLSREVEYDEAGNEVKYISYREDGSIYRWYEYLYDEAGYETKFVYYNGDGSIYVWSEYEYDKKGNQTKSTSYNEDDSIYAWSEYEYDEKGNQTKSINYNGDGSIYDWSEYEYDEIGNITKEMSYDENGLIKSRHEYEWDKDGNCTKYTAMGACSDDIYQCKCTYDEKGNITKAEYYNGDSIYEWCEYEYDAAGNETKRTVYNEGGSIINRYEYEYNEAGQETKYIYYNDDGNLNGWDDSEYDALGNIIKKTEYVGARYSSFTVLGELIIFKTARISAVTEYEYEYEYVDTTRTIDISSEEFEEIMHFLWEQVPEISEWSEYVADKSEGKAHIGAQSFDFSLDDVYRDYERTEYLGKYYLIYVGEQWEDHRVLWAYFYVSENLDEVLWYDIVMWSEYPVLYLDEWRDSDFYNEVNG